MPPLAENHFVRFIAHEAHVDMDMGWRNRQRKLMSAAKGTLLLHVYLQINLLSYLLNVNLLYMCILNIRTCIYTIQDLLIYKIPQKPLSMH